MDKDPEQGQQGHTGNLASPQDIRELLYLAKTLVEPVDEIYEAESYSETKIGSLCFREICYSDDRGNHASRYISVHSPKEIDDDEEEYYPMILNVGFDDKTGDPYLFEREDGDYVEADDMQAAIDICAEALLSKKLNEFETALALRVNAFLSGRIYGVEGDDSHVELPDGRRLKCAAAIGRAIASRTTDYLITKVYDDEVDDSELTITRYDKTDPSVFTDYSGTTIELRNKITDEYIKLHIEDNGTAAVTEIEDASEAYDYVQPEIGHLSELRAAVERVYARIHREAEEENPLGEWQDYLGQTLKSFSQMENLPEDAPENVKEEADEEFQRTRALLREAFQKKYSLGKGLSDVIIVDYRDTKVSEKGEVTFVPIGMRTVIYMDIKVTRLIAKIGERKTTEDFITLLGEYTDQDGTITHLILPLLPDTEIIKPENN